MASQIVSDEMTDVAAQIPIVDYLCLDGEPHLLARECDECRARFFDRRNACARCSQSSFHEVSLPTEGTLRTFTIVHAAAPGVEVPFIAGVVDCGGTSVRTNVINVAPDVDHVRVGMTVALATYSLGVDRSGREAVGFGFEPVGSEGTRA